MLMRSFVCSLLLSTSLFALPVGNPSEATLLSQGTFYNTPLRVGFFEDDVFDRHLAEENQQTHRQMDHAKISTTSLYAAFNFCNRFDIFSHIGTTKLYLESSFQSFFNVPLATRTIIETNADFSWGVGARITVWEWRCTSLGVVGEYFRTHPRVKNIRTETVTLAPHNLAKYSEWQLAVGLSHRFSIFVPYFAVKWAGSKLHWNHTAVGFSPHLRTFESKKLSGWVGGVSMVACDFAAITVEARFADEKAIYINGQLRI